MAPTSGAAPQTPDDAVMQAELLVLVLKYLQGIGGLESAMPALEQRMAEVAGPHLAPVLQWADAGLSTANPSAPALSYLLHQYGATSHNHLLTLIKELVNMKGARPTSSLLARGSLSLASTASNAEAWPALAPTSRKPLVPWQYVKGMAVHGGDGWRSINLIHAMQQRKRLLGHKAAVYVLIFDRTGEQFLTGADDCLIKLWRLRDGQLLHTFRGHTGDIVDLSVNSTNCLLASGSTDMSIRVWSFEHGKRMGLQLCVLRNHIEEITKVAFSPVAPDVLYTSSNEGLAILWNLNGGSNPQPFELVDDSNEVQTSVLMGLFHGGGEYLVLGYGRRDLQEGAGDDKQRATDTPTGTGTGPQHVSVVSRVCLWRICWMEGSSCLSAIKWNAVDIPHADGIYHIFWAPDDSYRFVTGSKAAGAHVFSWNDEGGGGAQQWQMRALDVAAQEPGQTVKKKPIRCDTHMVNWSGHGHYVVVSTTMKYERNTPLRYDVKVYEAAGGTLMHVLRAHDKEVFVLTPHPLLRHHMLTVGADGKVLFWNLSNGQMVKDLSPCEPDGELLDGQFSSDGLCLLVCDSGGYVIVSSCAHGTALNKTHSEQFFSRDYIPLAHDHSGFALDPETQRPTHENLGVLCNYYGVPYRSRLAVGEEAEHPLPTEPETAPPDVEEDISGAEELTSQQTAAGRHGTMADWAEGWDEDDGGEFSIHRPAGAAVELLSCDEASSSSLEFLGGSDTDVADPMPSTSGLSREERYQLRRQREEARRQRRHELQPELREAERTPGVPYMTRSHTRGVQGNVQRYAAEASTSGESGESLERHMRRLPMRSSPQQRPQEGGTAHARPSRKRGRLRPLQRRQRRSEEGNGDDDDEYQCQRSGSETGSSASSLPPVRTKQRRVIWNEDLDAGELSQTTDEYMPSRRKRQETTAKRPKRYGVSSDDSDEEEEEGGKGNIRQGTVPHWPTSKKRDSDANNCASAEWLLVTAQIGPQPYVLQVGDKVVYFKEGQQEKTLRPDCYDQLPLVAFCEVKGLDYTFPTRQACHHPSMRSDSERTDQHVWCRLHLRPDRRYSSFRFPEFTVTYRKSNTEPECIIPDSLYRNAMKADLQEGQVVLAEYDGQEWEGTVVEFSDQKGWENVVVLWTEPLEEGKETDYLNPWELRRPDGHRPQPDISHLLEDDTKLWLDTFKSEICQATPSCTGTAIGPLCPPGSHGPVPPKYARKVPYPITLPLVVTRIQQQFYRHNAAIVHDLTCLHHNYVAMLQGTTATVARGFTIALQRLRERLQKLRKDCPHLFQESSMEDGLPALPFTPACAISPDVGDDPMGTSTPQQESPKQPSTPIATPAPNLSIKPLNTQTSSDRATSCSPMSDQPSSSSTSVSLPPVAMPSVPPRSLPPRMMPLASPTSLSVGRPDLPHNNPTLLTPLTFPLPQYQLPTNRLSFPMGNPLPTITPMTQLQHTIPSTIPSLPPSMLPGIPCPTVWLSDMSTFRPTAG